MLDHKMIIARNLREALRRLRRFAAAESPMWKQWVSLATGIDLVECQLEVDSAYKLFRAKHSRKFRVGD